MIEVVLVRHAPTAWTGERYCGVSDPPLHAAGRAAAADLGLAIAGTLQPGARLVSSPRRRARETAEVIGAASGIDAIEFDDRWAEVDFGVVEGLTFDDLETRLPELARRLASGDTSIDWPGGESATEFRRRVHAAWQDIDGPIVIVSHAGPIRMAAALASGQPDRQTASPPPGGVVRLELDGPVRARSRATLRR